MLHRSLLVAVATTPIWFEGSAIKMSPFIWDMYFSEAREARDTGAPVDMLHSCGDGSEPRWIPARDAHGLFVCREYFRVGFGGDIVSMEKVAGTITTY